MQHPAGPAPVPAGHRGGGNRASREPDQLDRPAVRRPGLIRHQHRPAALRRGPGHRDVAAQADQNAAGRPDGPPGRARGPVRAHTLGGGTQVQGDSMGQPQQAAVQPDGGAARGRAGRRAVRLAVRVHGGEVTVVAQGNDRVPDRRVGAAAGPAGRRESHPDQAGEAVGEHEQPAPAAVYPGDLRVRPEPAGLMVQVSHDPVDGGQRRAEAGRRPDRDPRGGADDRPFRHRHRVVPGVRPQPGPGRGGCCRCAHACPLVSHPGRHRGGPW